MNDMFKYLQDLEDNILGNDLKQIRKMMEYEKEGMKSHVSTYE